MTGNALSLYFHIPFCQKRCPYCHFYVRPTKKSHVELFLKAILRELNSYENTLHKKEIVSIYFGGGTPSQIDPSFIADIFEALTKMGVYFSKNLEVTFECNPEDLDETYLKKLALTPVNRLSIGVQSLDKDLLTLLGRAHSDIKAKDVIFLANQLGFSNISLDLMYELPHQTVESFVSTLVETTKLPISHVSLYNLTIEPGTNFFRRQSTLEPARPSQTNALKMLKKAVEILEASGLKRYEISAFSKQGCQSIHNSGYWEGREFLGFGPSAFSYLNKSRFQNVCNLNKYLSSISAGTSAVDYREKLSKEAHLKELVAIHLRLKKGYPLDKYSNQNILMPIFLKLEKQGYLILSKTHAKLTSHGELFYDSVGEYFV